MTRRLPRTPGRPSAASERGSPAANAADDGIARPPGVIALVRVVRSSDQTHEEGSRHAEGRHHSRCRRARSLAGRPRQTRRCNRVRHGQQRHRLRRRGRKQQHRHHGGRGGPRCTEWDAGFATARHARDDAVTRRRPADHRIRPVLARARLRQEHGVGTYSGAALQQRPTPSDLLRAGLESDPYGPALVSARTRLTWRALDELSSRLASGYLELGLEPGDRIASLMPNRYELVLHYLACFRSGLVATPLNYRYTATEIDHALTVSGARIMLAHVERDEDLAASERVARLPLGTIGYDTREREGATFEALLEAERAPTVAAPEQSEPAVIFFTSGSTGPPKGVTHTHETLGWMFATAASGLEIGSGDLVLAGSSLSHVGAFYVTFGALGAGAGIVVARTYGGDELLPLLREDRPTVLSMLPSAL